MSGVRTLVKLGGTLLDDAASRAAICAQIATLAAAGAPLVVVHGGGKQMTRFLDERGVKSEFVNGLRVTSAEVVDAVLKVFAGSVNKQLVASLVQAGVAAVGLSGIDAALAEAEQLDPKLGFVGRVVKTNAGVLDTLVAGGFVPVVACVGGDRQGNVYNVNADQMAVACAAGFRADRLLFLTDVKGVLDANGQILPKLSPRDCAQLIADGVAKGGMQAKLESACAALTGGVNEVVIAPGAAEKVIQRLLAGEALGTRILVD